MERPVQKPAEEARSLWCLRISLLAASSLVLAIAFQWNIVDVLTPFFILPFLGALWLALAACAIWAVVYAVRHRRLGWQARRPLLVCITAVLVVAFVPFTDLWLRANFHLLRERREEVVRQVQAGVLRPNVEGSASLIALGNAAPTLSMGGNEIAVEEHGGWQFVFFFTCRGLVDNYGGFLFVPEGGDPRSFRDLSEANSTQLIPFGGAWYYAAHR